MIDWNKYKCHPPTRKPNKLKIPINNFGFNDDDIKEFNEIYTYCLEQEKKGELRKFVLTPSQGISIDPGVLRGARWNLTIKSTFIEILLRHSNANYYRFTIGYGKDQKAGISGRRAFQIYKAELEKDGVDLEEYAIDNGLEVKESIPTPKIECFVAFERTYHHAHHIDFNSAFNAGMIEAYPFLSPAVHRMYDKRKTHAYYKDVLNMTQGFMQSELMSYRFSHISKAGYEWTNKHLDELANELRENGRRILSFNVDGIWYQGAIYHNEHEGKQIGQWKHDNTNCTIRFKSKGCYEYIDNAGVYHPVYRGTTSYELIKPRTEWEWGDIFKGCDVKYNFIEGVGLVTYET